MSKEQDLIIKIKAQTEKAEKDVKALTKQVTKLSSETKKVEKSSTGVDKVSKSFSGLGKTIGGLVAGFSALAIGIQAIELAKLASDAEQSADAFEKVFTELGLNAEAEFQKIKDASYGLIPEQAIKQSATTAVSLGVPISKLSQLMEVARAKAREMGTDAQSAFNDLATGIGRGSPMILDNLGLTIKLGDANQKMADELGKTVAELSKQEKAMALTNAVIDAGSESIERYADAGLTSKEQMQQTTASIADLKVEIGNGLLPLFNELAISTNEWVQSLDPESIEQFGTSLSRIGGALIGVFKTIGILNDIALPDWLFGEDANLFGNAIKGWANLGDILDQATDEFDAMFNSMDRVGEQATKFDSLQRAVQNFTGIEEELGGLKTQLESVYEANNKLIKEWQGSDTELYKGALEALNIEQQKIVFELLKIAEKQEVYSDLAESTDEATEATKKLAQETAKYSEENINSVGDFYKERLATSKSTLSKLLSDEKKLTKAIAKAHSDLEKELKNISEDRFDSNLDITDQIREAQQESLNSYQLFADQQLQIEEKLALAKEALTTNQLDNYQTYIDQYKTLALETAGSEVTVAGVVKKTAQETASAKIAILKNVQGLENQYFDQRTQNAQTAHDIAVSQAEAELAGTKATIEAMKIMIDLMKTFVEQTTGKTLELDSSQLDSAVAKLEASNTLVESLTRRQGSIALDSTQVDQATAKIQQIQQATINGITLDVTANTTPLDFEIEKVIANNDGEEISIEINPEWEKAEKEIQTALDVRPVEKEIIADTSQAEAQQDQLVAKIQTPSTHQINVDNSAPQNAIAENQLNTSSTHTIYIREVQARSGGGSIPQRLAVGGSFRGSGKVAGYDASDSDKVNAYLTGGEYVIKRKAVDLYGVNFLNALNGMKLAKPKGYAEGGLVGKTQVQSNNQLRPLNLNIGGSSFGALIPSEVASAMQIFIEEQGGM